MSYCHGEAVGQELIHGHYCLSETKFWQMEARCTDGPGHSQLTGPGRVGLGSSGSCLAMAPCSKNTFQIESMSTGAVWCAALAGRAGVPPPPLSL